MHVYRSLYIYTHIWIFVYIHPFQIINEKEIVWLKVTECLTVTKLSGMTTGFPEEVSTPLGVHLQTAATVYQEC